MAKLEFTTKRFIELGAWDDFIEEVYGRPYNFQQQEGCKPRGVFTFTVPTEWVSDDDMHDEIPEVVNGEEMGVKFETWLARDPKQPLAGKPEDVFGLELFWSRNFYPDIYTLIDDLHKKGLLEEGEYAIDIDW